MLFAQLFNFLHCRTQSFFWAYRHIQQDQDFNKTVGERTDRQTDKSYGSI